MTTEIGDFRGQSMVEFALTIPLFLVLMLAMVDFGLGVYAYNTISYAAQEGMRRGIVLGKDCGAYQKDGNRQNFSGAGTPTYGDGVAANTSAQQTFTTTALTSPVCNANPTARATIVGAVNQAAGLLDRASLKAVIQQAPGGTTGMALPATGEDVKVRVIYRHRPIWSFVLEGFTRMTQLSLQLDMNAVSTGKIQ